MARIAVAKAADVPDNGPLLVTVDGVEIGIYRVGGQYYAWRNVCPHEAAPVCVGMVCGTRLPSRVYEYHYGREGEILRCPWHGWEFDLKTGEHLAGTRKRLKGYPVEEEAGQLYITV
ncbi:MAG: Rieske (2Fe-2S) protein [Alicyclobacillaceae bacterium]|nr:Rieske (2Fe-2S) protein [Alicyclobacillaceae bacterium]